MNFVIHFKWRDFHKNDPVQYVDLDRIEINFFLAIDPYVIVYMSNNFLFLWLWYIFLELSFIISWGAVVATCPSRFFFFVCRNAASHFL